jgi:hypothetical protein
VIVTCIVEGWPPFAAKQTWLRWDSGLYLSIAQHGYGFFVCPPGTPPGWCGNAGWFPAYPWIIGPFTKLGSPAAPTALVLAWLAGLSTLVLVWRALPAREPRAAAGIALAYAAFAPGMVYRYAIYPLSLLTLATVAFLFLMQRGRWLAAGVAAAVCVLTYPVGLAAAPAAVVWLIAQRSVPLRERARRIALTVYPSLVALWFFVTDQWFETGRWNAYLLVQRKYRHQFQDPFHPVRHAWHVVTAHGSWFTQAKAPALETLLVALVLVCVLIELVVRRGPSARADALVAIWAVLAWAGPLSESKLSTWRGEAALLPLALLVRRLPRPLGIAIAIAAAVLAVPMTKLYLANVLN